MINPFINSWRESILDHVYTNDATTKYMENGGLCSVFTFLHQLRELQYEILEKPVTYIDRERERERESQKERDRER